MEGAAENSSSTQQLANWVVLLHSSVDYEYVSHHCHRFTLRFFIISISEQKDY